MTSLVNMAKTTAEIKEEEKPYERTADKYPWGLELHLGTEELTKLGMTTLPPLGSQLNLIATVDVERLSESDDAESGVNRSVTLQITDMSLSSENAGSAGIDPDKYFGGADV